MAWKGHWIEVCARVCVCARARLVTHIPGGALTWPGLGWVGASAPTQKMVTVAFLQICSRKAMLHALSACAGNLAQLQVEQDLANPATNVSAGGMMDEVTSYCKQPSIADKDKVTGQCRNQQGVPHWHSFSALA